MSKHVVVTTNVTFRRLLEVEDGQDVQEIARRKINTGNWSKWLRTNRDFSALELDTLNNGKKVTLKAVEFDIKAVTGRKRKPSTK